MMYNELNSWKMSFRQHDGSDKTQLKLVVTVKTVMLDPGVKYSIEASSMDAGVKMTHSHLAD